MRLALVAGVAAGAAVLLTLTVYLLTREGAGAKVLVATWLAAPPVLLAAALLGLAAGRVGQSTSGEPGAPGPDT